MLDSGLFGGHQICASACGDYVAPDLLAFTSLGNNGPTLTPCRLSWGPICTWATLTVLVWCWRPVCVLCGDVTDVVGMVWFGFEDLGSVCVETCRSGQDLVLHPTPFPIDGMVTYC